jgi:hypothetical protein
MLLKARFDEFLVPLGFRRSFSTWLRNNEETTFGINIERWPLLESYWINLWIWLSPEVAVRRTNPPDMELRIEDLVEAEQRSQFLLLCDFELDSRDQEDKARELAEYLRDVGLPWLERFRKLADIQEAYRQRDWTVNRAMRAEGWNKFRSMGYAATESL